MSRKLESAPVAQNISNGFVSPSSAPLLFKIISATTGVATTVGTVAVKMLMAISCGAVFMGANTYIGNAPNFMVKSISDENGIKMPSFFGYMLCSLKFLIPVFIIDTLVFFL